MNKKTTAALDAIRAAVSRETGPMKLTKAEAIEVYEEVSADLFEQILDAARVRSRNDREARVFTSEGLHGL